MSSNTNPLLNELVTFIQHQIPGLADGEYQLQLSQRVNDSTGKPIADDSLTNQYTFAVMGDRFRIKNPADIVDSVFPGLNATGEFSNVLPHVVFAKGTFPWSRRPSTNATFTPPQPPADIDADVPTWLAVLLLDEDDVAAFPGLSLKPTDATLGDLFRPAAVPASSLGQNYSYFQAIATPGGVVNGLDAGEATGDPIQVLDLPLPLFWQLAPTLADLTYTAHVRRVSLVKKPTGRRADPLVPVGSFSIVFGTRLPQTGKKSFAYLVSLEKLETFLPTSDQGGAPADSTLDTTRSIRLAVLHRWEFFSVGQPATFVHQLLELNGRAPGQTADAVNTNLQLPYTGQNPVAANALGMGYVPMNETLRTGEKTVSWYRGPLVPYLSQPHQLPSPISSPDAVTSFDPTTGMLDASYAAAWTLGRLLALQDQGFSTALYNWKRSLSKKVVHAVEHQVLVRTFAHVFERAPAARMALAAMQDEALRIEAPPAGLTLLDTLMEALAEAAKTK